MHSPTTAGTQDRERSQDLSPEQVASIREELGAILASPSFAGSKRCNDFLECVVKHALAGDYDRLNERFLGVELFGRKVDFDTGADSIVRVRASDVRRRLAQYYSERSFPPAVTIGLSSGNYIPTFQWPTAVDTKKNGTTARHPSEGETSASAAQPPKKMVWAGARVFLKPLPLAAALLVLISVFVAAWNLAPFARNNALGTC
jgi:hypothetical protein